MYSIRDEECEDLHEFNLENRELSDPGSRIEYLVSDNSSFTANVRIRLSDTRARKVGGFEILADVKSLYK